MVSAFDPRILIELDPKHREPVVKEMARLIKENDDLKIENKTIAIETMQHMIGMENNVIENTYRCEFGPFYFVCTMNEFAIGPWFCVEDGYLTILLNFLWFTVGVDIPIGGVDEEDD